MDEMTRCDVILGDRFQIKYSVLRCAPLPPGSLFHGRRWINYFEGSQALTLKASMARLLQREDPQQHHTYMPESYVLGGDRERVEDDREAFLSSVEQDGQQRREGTWILKPSTGAKGAGIELLQGLPAMHEFLGRLDSSGSRVRWVAQRYVDRPLLLTGGRKFDVRVWVLLHSPFSIYLYSQGSCRTASAAYDPQDLSKRSSHITNHCVQEKEEGFGAFEEGNEMFFPELEAFLSQQQEQSSSPSVLTHTILPQIARVVCRTLLVMKPSMQVLDSDPYDCFQLFGYDLMITDDYQVKLLEINGSPGVAAKWLTPLVQDMREKVLQPPAPESRTASGRSASVQQQQPQQREPVWDVHKSEFILVWQDGDRVPEGLRVD